MTFHQQSAPTDAATTEMHGASEKKAAVLLSGPQQVGPPPDANEEKAVLHLPPRSPARSATSRDPLAHR